MSSHQPCADCGSSDALKEYAENTYCFSCNTSTQKKKPIKQGKSYFPTMYEGDEIKDVVTLPQTIESTMSMPAIKWCLTNGLTDALRKKYKIGYVHSEVVRLPNTKYQVDMSGRVILPYYEDEQLKFYQGRSVTGTNPKYLTVGDKGVFWSKSNPGNTVVIVEDIASAIRVGELCQAVSLCGTKINDKYLLTIVKNYETIILWLDNDRAGKQGMYKLTKQLQLFNKRVVQINSMKEAKQCWDSEIKTLLAL